MAQTTEIRAKLRVEDAASPVLARIKESFTAADKAAVGAQGSAVGFARQAAAAAVGVNVVGMVQTARATATEWMKAAAGPAAMRRQLTSMAMLLQDLPMEAAAAEADELAASFRAIGRETGIASGELRGAFGTLTEMGKGSREEIMRAKVELGQLAKIAEVLDVPIESAAREIGFLHEGMLKTKGQMFQLLNRTGVFGKDIRKAAESWQKMTEEQRAVRVAYALEQTAGKIGKLPMTWARVTGQIGNLMEGWKKDFGEPLLEAMIPELEKVVEMLGYGRGEIKLFAKAMGQDVGKWVRDAAKLMEEGFKYVRDHQEEIRKAIAEGVDKAKAVVQFILAHKEEIALAYGAKAVAPTVVAGAKTAGQVAGFMRTAGAAGVGGVALSTAATFAIFAAAVAAFALAVDQWQKLMAETGGGKSEAAQNQAARKEALERMAAAPQMTAASGSSIKQFEALKKAYVEGAVALGENSRAAGELADKAWAAHQAARRVVEPFEKASRAMDAWSKAAAAGNVPSDQELDQYASLVHKVGAMTEDALKNQSEGTQQYVANLLVNSKRLRDGLLEAGDLSADGFLKLASLVEGSSKEFAEALRAKGAEKSGGAKPPPPTISMTGGQTFKIVQDFRDQDPDRVAIALEEGIGRLVTRKVAAGTSSPFGT